MGLTKLRLSLIAFLVLTLWSAAVYILSAPTLTHTINESTPQVWTFHASSPSVNVVNKEELDLIHRERVVHLERECQKLHIMSTVEPTVTPDEVDSTAALSHLLVDDRHGILYCYVPKVACTNWKRVLMVLTGRANTSDAMSIPADAPHRTHNLLRLSSLNATEAGTRLRTYSKFLFARHPFERLLSAFKNKLEKRYGSSRYFQQRFGRYIVKKYRSNPSLDSLTKGNDVTFKEFVGYLVEQNVEDFNEHWKPISLLCNICSIRYDIVGKYETLAVDADYVLQRFRVGDMVTFPQPPLASTTRSQIKKYFKTVPPDLLHKLYDIYAADFALFNYTVGDVL